LVTSRVRVGPLFVPLAASMIVALWAGLARIGWPLAAAPRVVVAHGPLMVVGVMGTVISLERAVALGQTWALAAPTLSLACALGLVFGLPFAPCAWLAAGSALAYFATLVVLGKRAQDLSMLVITGGGAVLLAGSLRWALGEPIFSVLPFWTTWLVLTVAGERLELTRVLPPSRIARALLVTTAVALVASLAMPAIARGIATCALALWLVRFDVARRLVGKSGAPRFTALTLLSGYAWLFVAGVLLVRYGGAIAGPIYDATTHAFFLGFVFAMIFGHAPVILPAVAKVPLPFHRVFYAHVLLLHAGLAARIGGDVIGDARLRAWGGMANAIAILAFAAITVGRSLHAQRQDRRLRAVARGDA
jgi:hypothetical protein